MQVNIIIGSLTTSGTSKKLSTTISWVSPSATNQQLKDLAQTLNDLTTNTYTVTTKETKEEL